MNTSTMKLIYGLSLVSVLTLSLPAQAINKADLALDCKGTYQVLSATPQFKPETDRMTRAPKPAYAGATEQIKIKSLKGSGCDKLKPFYGIDLKVGMMLPYSNSTSPATPQQAQLFAKSEIGKIYEFEASQSFTYQLTNGELPLFPVVHSEYLSILNLYGSADSKALYGTKSIQDVEDVDKIKISHLIIEMKGYGISYQKSNDYQDFDAWLNLLKSLEFKNPDFQLEHIQNLLLIFKNMTKYTTQFFTLSAPNEVAEALAFNLNKTGKGKWSTKLEILKNTPALLNEQGVIWAKPEEVLNLTVSEIEEFLEHSLVQVKNLSLVSQVYEARVLKSQYQGAAIALEASPTSQNNHFELSPKSQELIKQIISL